MRLEKLTLLNFKNIAECELVPSKGINCIVGANGAGKTNLVDAIHYLSMSKSSLQMTDGQSLRHGEGCFMVAGEYTTDSDMGIRVNLGFRKGEGKKMQFCGKEYERLADHIGVVPLVMVSPADGALVSESADERRRWLNAFISQLDKGYLDDTMRYNRILAERNTLLKQGEMAMPELLDVVDERMASLAERVAATRRDTLEKLAPIVEQLYAEIAGESEHVELSYRSELNNGPFVDTLRAARTKDLVMGFSTCGIHRDDVVMTIGGYPLRKFGSQGQQKSFLLALKLAQYRLLGERLGERPILLLDDLFDKLDEARVARLVELTSGEAYGQVFITDCNRHRLASLLRTRNVPYRLFSVSEGEVAVENADEE